MELDFTNETVEKLLLKRMLVDKNWLNIISKTYDRRWFKTKNMQDIIESVLKYYMKNGKPPTVQTVQLMAARIKELHPDRGIDLAYVNQLLSDMQSKDTGLDDEVVNQNIKEFLRKNAFSYILLDNADILAEADGAKSSEKYQEVINTCLENFDKVQKIMFSDTDMGLNYFNADAMNAHWEFLKNPDAKIHTGWESVDTYTNGGFLKDGRMLGLFMAQAGLGKSVFLSNLAVNFLKQNLSVVVISLEMSQDVYAQRFDAHISHKNINALADDEQTARERIEAFYKQYPQSNLVIKEFPPRSINTRDIQVYLENLKSNGVRIDAVIVDYLNLVLPIKQSDSMFKDGMAVSEELRGLSYQLKCPVISAVQCNSDGMNKEEIDMQNVSESRGIVHTADVLFALYQTDALRENGRIGFKVLKNRLGGMVGKKSTFAMNPETLVLTDMTCGNQDISDESEDETNSKLHDVMDELNY